MTKSPLLALLVLSVLPASLVAQTKMANPSSHSQTGYQAQFLQPTQAGKAPVLRLSHNEDGHLWETSFSTNAPIHVVSTAVTQTRLLVLGNFNDNLWINNLYLAAGPTGDGFLAVFDRDSGDLDQLIRIGGSQTTLTLGLVSDNENWLIIGRYAGKVFYRSLDLERLMGDLNLDHTGDKGTVTLEGGLIMNTTGMAYPVTPPSGGPYQSTGVANGDGVMTNPGDTGQDPAPTGVDPSQTTTIPDM